MTTPSWKLVRVGDVASLLNGYAFASQGFSIGSGVPLIRIRDLGSKTTDVNFVGNFPNQYVVKNGDLLIGMDGDFNVVKWNGGYALLNQRVCKLESMDASVLCDDFLFHRIIEEIEKINRTTAATTVKHLASKDVLGIEIHLPPSAEQSKIAEVLSKVDSAIAQTEAQIAKQQRIKTGLMQDLPTRGIDEHGQLRSEATHAFKDSPLGRIPVEWEVRSLRDLLNPRNQKAKQILSTEYMQSGKFPVVDQSAGFICGFCDDEDKVISTELPLTVFGDHTRHVKFVDFPFVAGADGTQLLKARNVVDEKLFYFLVCFAAEKIGNYGYDRHFKHLKAFQCALPTLDTEQAMIAGLLSAADDATQDSESALAKLRHLKTALMQDLLTGKVRVTPLLQQAEEAASA